MKTYNPSWMAMGLTWVVATLPCVAAPDLPPAVLPEGVGVNIHFTRGHERDLDLIAAAGFKFVRMDFSWGGTERKQGEYTWTDYDELTANLEKRGLRALYILDYSNGLYEDTIVSRDPISGKESRSTAAPRKPESWAAFARWAAAAAKHFQGRRIIWEIWNEPNIGFWRPEPNVNDYTQLVLATGKALKAADPQATLIAPASSGFPWTFFEKLFAGGALEHLDAVSVHPYRSYSQGPETAEKDYRRLRGLIARYAPAHKKNLPIISGEWGYASHAKGGVSLDTQAAFIARQQLANLYHGVPLSIWYDWKNDGSDTNYNEHNFGTVTQNLNPKPAYTAVQTLTRQLSGYRIARRLDAGHDDAWVLLCVNKSGDQKLAAWSSGKPRPATVDIGLKSADDLTGVDGSGQPQRLRLQGGKLELDLQPAPQYITLKQPSPLLSATAAWQIDHAALAFVEAGKQSQFVLPVETRNPFSRPIGARVEVEMPPGKKQAGSYIQIEPDQVNTHKLSLRIDQRFPESLPTLVRVEYLEPGSIGDFKPLGSWTEPHLITLLDPLNLTAVPTEAGCRLLVRNPGKSSFRGKACVDAYCQEIQLSTANPDMDVNIKGATLSGKQMRSASLVDLQGTSVVRIPVPRIEPLSVSDWRAALDGDAKVPAHASVVATNAPGGKERPFAQAWRLDYQFDAGWRFVRAVPQGGQAVAFEGRPQALGMWIYGDGSKNVLRARVTDERGQTFQPNGPALDWTGWRWVAFDLADLSHAGHWGGPDDGQVHGKLRLDTPLLVDGSRNKTAGSVCFTGLCLVYPIEER